jgi:transcriptional activator of cad operon
MASPGIRVESPFSVGPWTVDARKNIIERQDHRVRVEPKAMRVLVCLAERCGEDVLKDEILRVVWGAPRRSPDVLTNAIWELRKALGDDSRSPDFIQTVPRRGYRLVAPVDAKPNRSRHNRNAMGSVSSWLGALSKERRRAGFLEGQRAALLRVLKASFGALSDEVVKRILALETSTSIDEHLDRASGARSLGEMGLE